ncbi:hypothetical protein WAI453_006623 [Rhynchosporium graminicola]|uniref:AB hydrolase-1 domain-containing protein n=1 Tax=Rhynchosporium graminicola TaxID=2792576 RepID=A0A1E1K3F0_9HELO|nr:uncharacterized protein RCO7_11322 [Rhynchosporium commune]
MSASSLSVSVPGFLSISTKPNAPISYTFFPAIDLHPTPYYKTLIVCVNGLGLPAASWIPAITTLQSLLQSCPAILTYDRFGQGLTTSRDPLDGQKGKELGHDFLDVAYDLHQIILKVAAKKLGLQRSQVEHGSLQLLLVGASIGAPIARLFAQSYQNLVSGLVLLDSNIANVNYSDFLPDPESPDFDADSLLSTDCTLKQYREARLKVTNMFDLNAKNPEGLDRTNSPVLLPYSNQPKLLGPGESGPLLSVVGHDPDTFADVSLAMMGIPKSLSKITNEYWAQYNDSLTEITDVGKCKGVVTAKGCGHFIQKDNPYFVAQVISDMVKELGC